MKSLINTWMRCYEATLKTKKCYRARLKELQTWDHCNHNENENKAKRVALQMLIDNA